MGASPGHGLAVCMLLAIVSACAVAKADTDTYDDLTLCVQLCTDATQDFELLAMLYNEEIEETYRKCTINVHKGTKEGDQVCCSDGGQPTTYFKDVDGHYTAFIVGAQNAATAPADQCLGQLIIKNGEQNVQQLKSFIQYDTNKCGLTHETDKCRVVAPDNEFQTGEYSHIHIGTAGQCLMAGATLSNPVSQYCSAVHVYSCQQPMCISASMFELFDKNSDSE